MNFDGLKEFMDFLVEEKGIPGVDVTVYQRHKPVFRYNTGWRDREKRLPIEGDEAYFMYSATKPLTVTCALQLMEKGLFLMNDPLEEYLPEFADMQVMEFDAQGMPHTRPARRPIRIRDLFTMTAGLDYNLKNPAIERVVSETGGEAPTRRVVAALAKCPLGFDPGAQWQYSLCHDVLGALVEVLSGMRFETYMQKMLFEPLGMKMSSLHLTSAQSAKLAMQYRKQEDGAIVRTENTCTYTFGSHYDSGGAGLVSTLNDYIRFADALACGGVGMTGERILTQSSVELMRTNHLNSVQMETLNWPQLVGYGYGLGVRTMIDRTQGALSPVGEFGWGGAAGAHMVVDPEKELSLFYTQHMLNSMGAYIHPRLRNVLYACLGRE